MSKLTAEGRRDLDKLEKIVRDGEETFWKVANALFEIHERKLYKEYCSTFASYVQVRFGITRAWAYRQVAAVETMKLLASGENVAIGDTLPPAEAVLRPLTTLLPEQRAEAFEEAKRAAKAEGRPKPTATHTTAAVASRKKDKKQPPKSERSGVEARESADSAGATTRMEGSGPPAPRSLETESQKDEAGAVTHGLKSTTASEAREAEESPVVPSSDVPPASESTSLSGTGGVVPDVLLVPVIVRALFRGISGYGPVGQLPSPTSADLLAIEDDEANEMLLLSMWLKNAHTRRKNLIAQSEGVAA